MIEHLDLVTGWTSNRVFDRSYMQSRLVYRPFPPFFLVSPFFFFLLSCFLVCLIRIETILSRHDAAVFCLFCLIEQNDSNRIGETLGDCAAHDIAL